MELKRHDKQTRMRQVASIRKTVWLRKKVTYHSPISLEQKSKILSALIKKGVTQKTIAERAGVTAQTVGNVISGKARSQRIERIITEMTGFVFPPNQRVTRKTEYAELAQAK